MPPVQDNGVGMTAATPATIDINYILAERSREYFGEGYRWLIWYVRKMDRNRFHLPNLWHQYRDHTPATVTRTISPYLYLRPIPTGQLDGMEMTTEEKAAYQNPILIFRIVLQLFAENYVIHLTERLVVWKIREDIVRLPIVRVPF